MKSKIVLTLLLLWTTVIVAQKNSTYGKISYEKAVNLSGKQRMLSQKIAKVIVLRIGGAETPALKSELNSSKIIFERNLKILKDNSVTQSSKIRASINAELNQWNEFKALIEQPIGDIDLLLSLSEELLRKCHYLVLAIEEESKFNNQLGYSNNITQLKVETVNLAGKQRMLSQKMCMYYAACRVLVKGKKADIACGKYITIFNQMNVAVNDLLVNELNNSQIDTVISEILSVMTELQSKNKDFRDNRISLGEIIQTTNVLLDLFNKATSLYSL